MKARHVLAATLTLILLLASVVPAFASAEPVVTREQSDFEWRLTNPCTDEEVVITGQTHTLSLVLLSPAGRAVLTSHQNELGSGVGEFGTSYQFVNNANSINTLAVGDLPWTETFTSEWRMIGDGPGSNFVQTVVWHRTVNPDGTVTSRVEKLVEQCA